MIPFDAKQNAFHDWQKIRRGRERSYIHQVLQCTNCWFGFILGKLFDKLLINILPVFTWVIYPSWKCWLLFGTRVMKISVGNTHNVAGAVLQSPLMSLIYSFINCQSPFSSKSARYYKSQAVRARDMTFWDNVHHSLCVTCHRSCVTFHMSCVTCNMSCVAFYIFFTNLFI